MGTRSFDKSTFFVRSCHGGIMDTRSQLWQIEQSSWTTTPGTTLTFQGRENMVVTDFMPVIGHLSPALWSHI